MNASRLSVSSAADWTGTLAIACSLGVLGACGGNKGGPADATPEGASGQGSSGQGPSIGTSSGSSGAGSSSNASSGTGIGGSGSGSDGDSGSGSGSGADSGAVHDAFAETGSSDSSSNDGASSGSRDASSCTASATSTAGTSGYMGDWSAGDYPSDFSAGNYLTISGVTGQMGNDRQYAVHVPTGYSKSTPLPALFCIHGLGQTASMFCLDTGVAWPAKADQEGFVVIMPNGYMNSWNGGTCCGSAAQAGLDDVALMRAIFAEVGKHVNIDLRRVYSTGLSNGAFLSYRLACEASDLVVAVAPNSGAVGTAAAGGGISTLTTSGTTDWTTCAPSNKVSILDIHGTSDPLIPYSNQAPSIAFFQASDGCSMTTMPATIAPSGGDTTCVSFAGCPACPNVNVTACSIMGGGHCWFGSSDCGTGGGGIGTAIVGNNSNFMMSTDVIWGFFSQISR